MEQELNGFYKYLLLNRMDDSLLEVMKFTQSKADANKEIKLEYPDYDVQCVEFFTSNSRIAKSFFTHQQKVLFLEDILLHIKSGKNHFEALELVIWGIGTANPILASFLSGATSELSRNFTQTRFSDALQKTGILDVDTKLILEQAETTKYAQIEGNVNLSILNAIQSILEHIKNNSNKALLLNSNGEKQGIKGMLFLVGEQILMLSSWPSLAMGFKYIQEKFQGDFKGEQAISFVKATDMGYYFTYSVFYAILLFMLVGAFLGIIYKLGDFNSRKKVENIFFHIPILGNLIRFSNLHTAFELGRIFIQGGAEFKQAITAMKNGVKSPLIKEDLEMIEDKIIKGSNLGEALMSSTMMDAATKSYFTYNSSNAWTRDFAADKMAKAAEVSKSQNIKYSKLFRKFNTYFFFMYFGLMVLIAIVLFKTASTGLEQNMVNETAKAQQGTIK